MEGFTTHFKESFQKEGFTTQFKEGFTTQIKEGFTTEIKEGFANQNVDIVTDLTKYMEDSRLSEKGECGYVLWT